MGKLGIFLFFIEKFIRFIMINFKRFCVVSDQMTLSENACPNNESA